MRIENFDIFTDMATGTKGQRLRQARSRHFGRAREAAAALGVKPSTYTSHENGQRDFDDASADLYARRFKVPVEWLIYGRGSPDRTQGASNGIPISPSTANPDEAEQTEEKAGSVMDDLRNLIRRSGRTYEEISRGIGYKQASSLAHYTARFHGQWLPVRFLKNLLPELVGYGQPAITQEEVLRLGGPFVAGAVAGTSTIPEGAEKVRMPTGLIPLYGNARGGPDGQFEMQGEPLDRIQAPPILDKVGEAYAVRVVDDSMSPKYEHGQTVYINPNIIPRRSHYVIAQVKREADNVVEAFVKRFVKWTWDELVLEQFNPEKQLTFPHGRVVSVHVIVHADEL